MNPYEQLVAIRSELQGRGARPQTLTVMDELISKAVVQRDSPTSVSQLMILRHILRSPPVLNNEDVYLDVLDLQGDLEEVANNRAEPEAAYVDVAKRPKLHSHYKKRK